MELLMIIIVAGTSIWVLIDTITLGVQKGQAKGMFNMGPAGWFFSCLLLWIVSFPVYLHKRPAYKQKAIDSSTTTKQTHNVTSEELETLKELATMRDNGLITEKEFTDTKQKILRLKV